MGILGLTDPTKVVAFTNLPEVKNMDTKTLQQYVDRAEYIASRLYDYDSTLPAYVPMMEYAIDLLIENLVVMNIPSFKRSLVAKLRAEQIGSYSYSKDTKTGDSPQYLSDELMMILNSFKFGTDPRIAYETTMVFMKRSESVDQSGIKWYVPEDVDSAVGVQDPAIPLDVLRRQTPL